ncbi:TPA: hypothetical protein O7L60_004293 [Escherichia coli]|uniref:hypothetical protein n=1 Tax=Enterobacterales TaxID=91347 RepID=UPI00285C8D9A|nr:hypothetical protein [Escherichia coli]MDR5969742.1 hypothetical protein [Escherichia coli]MDR6042527.1 hypothetical protein [Escherichia coli]MDR6057112.1 hypothetical protein [Escherichia coli]HDB9567325.1 hypothetical protein [Escherichia coli]
MAGKGVSDESEFNKNGNGVWLDSNCNERKLRAVEVDGKIKRVLINYKDYMPTHQLSAIVEAAFAMGALQLED